MKKEELELIFADAEGVPDLGPIEEHLHALASEQQLPDLAVAMCAARFEEAAPALRAVLARAADREPLSEDEEMLLFRGLYILGGARDSEVCQPLLRLLRRPDDEIDALLGDAITEGLAKIIAGVFDGDADALFDTITDRSVDEFVREALLGAATFLAWEGRIERARLEQFLEQFYDQRLANDGDQAWVGWLEAIALLGLRNLAPLVHRAWDEGYVPPDVLERHHFENDLRTAEQAPDDINRFKQFNLGLIDDVLDALQWTCWQSELAEGEEPLWSDALPDLNEPVRNAWRHVGRNDPCPCGSGRKAKKCCLAG